MSSSEQTHVAWVRSLIFILIAVATAIPLFVPLGLKMSVSQNVQMCYDLIETARTNDRDAVILSFDYDPSTMTELHPMAVAIADHCYRKGYRILGTALWPMGRKMCSSVFDSLKVRHPEIEYGRDFVNLGYKAGGIVTIERICDNIRPVYPMDASGTPIDSLEIMKGINNFESYAAVISLSAGAPGITEWVLQAGDNYNIPVTGGVTGVTIPSILPYIPNQLKGVLGGLKGAAEYEMLNNRPGFASNLMDSQSIAHLMIILFIIAGNINYYMKSKGGKS